MYICLFQITGIYVSIYLTFTPAARPLLRKSCGRKIKETEWEQRRDQEGEDQLGDV